MGTDNRYCRQPSTGLGINSLAMIPIALWIATAASTKVFILILIITNVSTKAQKVKVHQGLDAAKLESLLARDRNHHFVVCRGSSSPESTF